MWGLDYKESWALKNWCFWTVVLEKILESPLDCKEIQSILMETSPVLNIHWKDWCWSWNSNPLATWCEKRTHLKRPWCSERLRAGGEGDNKGWDGWMASPTQWTWVWVNSGSWWWTWRPGVLQSMGLQRAGHDWATKLTDWLMKNALLLFIQMECVYIFTNYSLKDQQEKKLECGTRKMLYQNLLLTGVFFTPIALIFSSIHFPSVYWAPSVVSRGLPRWC